MAIVACPECGKKISSQTPVCSNCGFEQGEVSEADLDVFRARRLRDRIYRLNMVSYVAITVFVAGFGWYWWDSAGFSQASSRGPFVLMGFAALGTFVFWRGHRTEKLLPASKEAEMIGFLRELLLNE